MAGSLRLTREQLAKFLGSHEEIRQFEKLIALVDQNLNSVASPVSDIDSVSGSALAMAQSSEAQVQALADALGLAPVAPDLSDILSRLSALEIAPANQPHVAQQRYGSFYSTATQTAAAINTAYPITFDVTELAFGVSVASSSRLTVDRAGVFNVDYDLHLHETSGGTRNAWTWLRVSGTDATYSTEHSQVSGNGTESGAGGNFLLSLKAGDYVEIMWAVDNVGLVLSPDAASGFAPAGPSVRCSITQYTLGG